jgi:hypothetical protein
MSDPKQISVDVIATRINAMHREATKAAITAVELAIEIGAMLMEVKATLPHGEFGPWIRKHCEFTDRTARNYMKLAKAVPALDDANRQRVSDLSLRGALAEFVDKPDAPLEDADEQQKAVTVAPVTNPAIHVELTPEEQDAIDRIAAPLAAIRVVADEWREQKSQSTHTINAPPVSVKAFQDDVVEGEYREIITEPASTTHRNPVNCDNNQTATDAMRQSVEAIAAAEARREEQTSTPPLSRNRLLRDAASLIGRIANGEEITRDDAESWLLEFGAWSREIGMEDRGHE